MSREESRLNQFALVPPDRTAVTGESRATRTLVLAGLAHALHDGPPEQQLFAIAPADPNAPSSGSISGTTMIQATGPGVCL
jgi:hypothetical protein